MSELHNGTDWSLPVTGKDNRSKATRLKNEKERAFSILLQKKQVDIQQNDALNALHEVDCKHNKQFYAVAISVVLMVIWNIALTASVVSK